MQTDYKVFSEKLFKSLAYHTLKMKLTKETWNEQYDQGKWDYVDNTSESCRASIIGFYCNRFNNSPDILDVGCGKSVVRNYIKFKTYIGLDISETATKHLKNQNIEIINTDAEKFTTEKKFDIIIFGEILYYVNNKILEQYQDYLNEDGYFIISLWDHPKTRELWISINEQYECVDSIELKNHKTNNKWLIGIFKTKEIKDKK